MAAMETATIELTGDRVEPADVVAVARHGAGARLSAEARAAMEESAAVVERLAELEEPVYGVSTGFGSRRAPGFRRTGARSFSAL